MSVIKLDALFDLPDTYQAVGGYAIDVDNIKEIGTLPPYRPVGFNRKVEVVPYILTHDGRDIMLADIEKNHEGIQTLADMFAANRYLYDIENLPADTELTKDIKKNIRTARKIVNDFDKQYVSTAPVAHFSLQIS